MLVLNGVKLQPEMLKDKVVTAIRDAILNKELEPGERLVESRFVRQLGVSRAPLRDAFWALEKQGYVRMIPHKGTFVIKLSLKEVQEVYEVRRSLEAFAFAQARQRVRPEDLKELRNILREMRTTAEKNDLLSNFRADLKFHQTIWKLSGNSKLEEILNNICPSLFTYLLIKYQSNPSLMREGIEAHNRLLKALSDNVGSVEASIQSELEKMEKTTLRCLEKLERESKASD